MTVTDSNVHRRVAFYTAGFLLICTGFLIRVPWQDSLIWGDFSAFWTAARLVVSGHTANVYDLSAQAAVQGDLLHKDLTSPPAPFFYPPTFVLFCIPLGTMPLYVALASFMLVTGVAYLWAARRVAWWAWMPALAFPSVTENFFIGQNGMLTAAFVGGGLSLLDRRPRLSGLLLGAMVIKPHLAIGIPIALLATRRWQVLIYAALSGSLICLASGIVLGWDVWQHFIMNGSRTARHILEDGLLPFYKILSIFGLAMDRGATLRTAYLAQTLSSLLAIATLLWVLWRGRSETIERSTIVVAGLLMSPYILVYDMIVMVFPCLWLMTRWFEQKKIPTVEGLLVLMTYLTTIVGLYLIEYFPFFLVMRIVWILYLVRTTLTWKVTDEVRYA